MLIGSGCWMTGPQHPLPQTSLPIEWRCSLAALRTLITARSKGYLWRMAPVDRQLAENVVRALAAECDARCSREVTASLVASLGMDRDITEKDFEDCEPPRVAPSARGPARAAPSRLGRRIIEGCEAAPRAGPEGPFTEASTG